MDAYTTIFLASKQQDIERRKNKQKHKKEPAKNTQRHKGKKSQKRGEGQDIGKNSLIIQEDYIIHEKYFSNKFAIFFYKIPNTFAKKSLTLKEKNSTTFCILKSLLHKALLLSISPRYQALMTDRRTNLQIDTVNYRNSFAV